MRLLFVMFYTCKIVGYSIGIIALAERAPRDIVL